MYRLWAKTISLLIASEALSIFYANVVLPMIRQPDFKFLKRISSLMIVLTIVPSGASVNWQISKKSSPVAQSYTGFAKWKFTTLLRSSSEEFAGKAFSYISASVNLLTI
jgi:hypothetical protein